MPLTAQPPPDYVRFVLDHDFNVALSINSTIFWIGVVIAVAVIAAKVFGGFLGIPGFRSYEIDQAEFGLGDQKLTLKPNDVDRQIAYKIWVELCTRKIGLPIDPEHDVLFEVYDSWHNFFAVTRELIKDVPVVKFRRKDTEKIINLSIEVLNTGIRPHLTQWQARFRRWYDWASAHQDHEQKSPQEIQREFPAYDELMKDLERVNKRLIQYREKMLGLVKNS